MDNMNGMLFQNKKKQEQIKYTNDNIDILANSTDLHLEKVNEAYARRNNSVTMQIEDLLPIKLQTGTKVYAADADGLMDIKREPEIISLEFVDRLQSNWNEIYDQNKEKQIKEKEKLQSTTKVYDEVIANIDGLIKTREADFQKATEEDLKLNLMYEIKTLMETRFDLEQDKSKVAYKIEECEAEYIRLQQEQGALKDLPDFSHLIYDILQEKDNIAEGTEDKKKDFLNKIEKVNTYVSMLEAWCPIIDMSYVYKVIDDIDLKMKDVYGLAIDLTNELLDKDALLAIQSSRPDRLMLMPSFAKQIEKNKAIIEMSKSLPALVNELLDNRQVTLESNNITEKISYLVKIKKLNDFFGYANVNKLDVTDEERLFSQYTGFIAHHKRGLEDTAREITAQIYNLLNQDKEGFEVDPVKLAAKLRNKSDIKGIVNTMIDFLIYNSEDNKLDPLLAIAIDAFEEVREGNMFSDEEQIEFRATLANKRMECLMAYKDNCKNVLKYMPTDMSQDEKDKMANYIAYLSKSTVALDAIDKLHSDITLSWSSELLPEINRKVNRYNKEHNIDLGELNKTEEKIVDVNKIEYLLWNSKKNSSHPVGKMLNKKYQQSLQHNTKVSDQLTLNNIKENLLAKQKEAIDNEVNEDKKAKKKEELFQTKNLFVYGDALHEKIKKLLFDQQRVLYSRNKEDKIKFLNEISAIESYLENLKIICNKYGFNDAYKEVEKNLNIELDRLSETTAKLVFKLVDFDKLQNVYNNKLNTLKQQAKEEENNNIFFDGLDKRIYAYELICGMLKKKIEGGVLFGTEEALTAEINKLPEGFKESVLRIRESANSRLESPDQLKPIFAVYEKMKDKLIGIRESRSGKLNEIEREIYLISKEAKQLNKLKGALENISFIKTQRIAAIETENIADKGKYLDKISMLKGLFDKSYTLKNDESIKANLKFIGLSKRYITNVRQSIEPYAKEVAQGIGKQLIPPIKPPVINVKKTRRKMSNYNEMDGVVEAFVEFEKFNPGHKALDKRLIPIEEEMLVLFSADNLPDKVVINFLEAVYKYWIKSIDALVAVYNSLKDMCGDSVSEKGLMYMSSLTPEFRDYEAINYIVGCSRNMMITDSLEREFNRITRSQDVASRAETAKKASAISDDSLQYEKSLWKPISEEVKDTKATITLTDILESKYIEANRRALRRAFGA